MLKLGIDNATPPGRRRGADQRPTTCRPPTEWSPYIADGPCRDGRPLRQQAYTEGCKVITTVRSDLQNAASQSVRDPHRL